MLDSISLNQLVMFAAVVDEGSFSAAGRKLHRVQSAVSHAMGNLEKQLGIELWDRSSRVPTLTAKGRLLLMRARRVLSEAGALRDLASQLVGGVEPRISLAIDALFPLKALVSTVREFRATYPAVELGVHTETLSTVSALVVGGTCDLGVVSADANASGLVWTHCSSVHLVTVASPRHPLSSIQGSLSVELLGEHVQIVLSERGRPANSPDRAVLSPQTWRVGDLETKRALLLGGLGWGNMPEHAVRSDLARRRLVRIRPAAWDDEGFFVPLAIVRRPTTALGPAMQWLSGRLSSHCAAVMGANAKPHPKRSHKSK